MVEDEEDDEGEEGEEEAVVIVWLKDERDVVEEVLEGFLILIDRINLDVGVELGSILLRAIGVKAGTALIGNQ